MALLAPYLATFGQAAASKAGEAAFVGAKALLDLIRRRLSQDEYGSQTLARLEQKPEDRSRQVALEGLLAERVRDDPEFAREIRRVVHQTTGDRPVGQFLTEVYGGEVGKIVNIGSAGTVNID